MSQINHDLTEGDKVECSNGSIHQINDVRADGSVVATRVEGDSRTDSPVEWTHDGIVTALVHGDVERVSDGKSHELAGSF